MERAGRQPEPDWDTGGLTVSSRNFKQLAPIALDMVE